jgi:hypothetical protein
VAASGRVHIPLMARKVRTAAGPTGAATPADRLQHLPGVSGNAASGAAEGDLMVATRVLRVGDEIRWANSRWIGDVVNTADGHVDIDWTGFDGRQRGIYLYAEDEASDMIRRGRWEILDV